MPTVLGAAALLALVLVVVLFVGRGRTERELSAAHADLASLRAQMEALTEQLAAQGGAGDRDRPGPRRREATTSDDDPGYVITQVGDLTVDRIAAEPARIDRTLFADLLLRETVVKTASLAHGLRVALAPETRNRIRFEMRQEVRRARKLRRAQLKEARREWEARQRADLPRPDNAGTTAGNTAGNTAGDAA